MLDTKNYAKAYKFSKTSIKTTIKMFNSSLNGLKPDQVVKNRETYGANVSLESQEFSLVSSLKRSFINPFSLILLVLIIVAIFTDVIFVSDNQRSYAIILIMFLMIMLSGLIRFIQEFKSRKITTALINEIESNNCVLRDGKYINLNAKDLVVGDLVRLKSNDVVGADMRIIEAQDCLVSESILSGETNAIHKNSKTINQDLNHLVDFENILFAKTKIIHGEALAIVFGVGNDTLFGTLTPNNKPHKNGFDNGSNSIAWVLIKFMVTIVPLVFIVSAITSGDWLTALIFALSVSIGLTPELLPMVITTSLVKGSHNMARKKTIVKNVNAMQMFGNMDVLCVDKTGTLTNDEIILEYYIDILGNESKDSLDYARLSSYFTKNRNNHIDKAILKTFEYPNFVRDDLINGYTKVDEHAFDYKRKISSVTLKNDDNYLLICKGSAKDLIGRCKYVKYHDELIDISKNNDKSVYAIIDEMLEEGMKVIAIAFKTSDELIVEEDELTLIGYLAFFDAPKKSSKSAIDKLKKLNVNPKVLTGDILNNAKSICKRLGIKTENALIGEELDLMDDDEALTYVEKADLFAELNPRQKARIVSLLKQNGHIVGYLADGVNDLPAIYNADVAISVDNALELIKEAADVILLKKDLNVLEEGIIEGRKAFVNMTKYIKITASSNLGNILSIVIASLLLPFFPMTSIQLLLLNLLYDGLCLSLPWDNVDDSQIKYPLEWSGKNLSRFMCFFAPISSFFDLVTFICLLYFVCPMILGFNSFDISMLKNPEFISLFQTGWFLESMWTQILILYSLRTKEISYRKSRPSFLMISITLIGVLLCSNLVMSHFGSYIGLSSLPLSYFIFLALIVICYMTVINLAKIIYVKKYGELI